MRLDIQTDSQCLDVCLHVYDFVRGGVVLVAHLSCSWSEVSFSLRCFLVSQHKPKYRIPAQLNQRRPVGKKGRREGIREFESGGWNVYTLMYLKVLGWSLEIPLRRRNNIVEQLVIHRKMGAACCSIKLLRLHGPVFILAVQCDVYAMLQCV